MNHLGFLFAVINRRIEHLTSVILKDNQLNVEDLISVRESTLSDVRRYAVMSQLVAQLRS